MVYRDIDEAAPEEEEGWSLQQVEAAVSQAQRTLHLTLPVGNPDAGGPPFQLLPVLLASHHLVFCHTCTYSTLS